MGWWIHDSELDFCVFVFGDVGDDVDKSELGYWG
jgi:hypothetical protein